MVDQRSSNIDDSVDSDGYLGDTDAPQRTKSKRKVLKPKSKEELAKRERAKTQRQYLSDSDQEDVQKETKAENGRSNSTMNHPLDDESYVEACTASSSSFTHVGTDDSDQIIKRNREGKAVEYEAADSCPPDASLGEGLKAMGKTFFTPKN